MSSWMPLIEYSNKYGVSISTLRRRIKSDTIKYKSDDGKYFIQDREINRSKRGRKLGVPKKALERAMNEKKAEQVMAPQEAPVAQDLSFSASHKMLEELKKAYTVILKEREDQIFYLREEIADLKTLCKVYEQENDRLRIAELDNQLPQITPLD